MTYQETINGILAKYRRYKITQEIKIIFNETNIAYPWKFIGNYEISYVSINQIYTGKYVGVDVP